MYTRVKTDKEIAAMRQSGKLLATILKLLTQATQPGVSSKYLADIAAKELKAQGGRPAFLGYQDFPDVLCVSINQEVVHGIPKTDKIIGEGDIVSLDFGVIYDGMITDGAVSFICGQAKRAAHKRLITVTEQSMYSGIDAVCDGVKTGDIGAAVEAVLVKNGFGIVRDLVGHGVGHYLHEDPNIPNYGRIGTGPLLRSGMTIAIEPMATLGGDGVRMTSDGWTVITADNSMAAHFEHTVLVTDDGAEVLTTV